MVEHVTEFACIISPAKFHMTYIPEEKFTHRRTFFDVAEQDQRNRFRVEIKLLHDKNKVIGDVFLVLKRKRIEVTHLFSVKDHQVKKTRAKMKENPGTVNAVFITSPDTLDKHAGGMNQPDLRKMLTDR